MAFLSKKGSSFLEEISGLGEKCYNAMGPSPSFSKGFLKMA